ncbi:hypothetical protein [Vibrio phage PJN101]|nr:hypothetical protein [Vibrio phage PJN101]
MKISLTEKLYKYWLDNHVLRPNKINHIIGYNVLNYLMGWHYEYRFGHSQMYRSVQTYKGAWQTSKLNHKHTLNELHKYIAKYGDLGDKEKEETLDMGITVVSNRGDTK